MELIEIALKVHVFGDKMEVYFMHELKRPKFLDGMELPASYYQPPDPYNDAPSCEISLLALSRYARSKNKRITDLSCEEVLRFRTSADKNYGNTFNQKG